MITIIKQHGPMSEANLNQQEKLGRELISVNHVVTHEYPPGMGITHAMKQEVVRWVYHFRTREEES